MLTLVIFGNGAQGNGCLHVLKLVSYKRKQVNETNNQVASAPHQVLNNKPHRPFRLIFPPRLEFSGSRPCSIR